MQTYNASERDQEFRFWLLLPKAVAEVLASPRSPLMAAARTPTDSDSSSSRPTDGERQQQSSQREQAQAEEGSSHPAETGGTRSGTPPPSSSSTRDSERSSKKRGSRRRTGTDGGGAGGTPGQHAADTPASPLGLPPLSPALYATLLSGMGAPLGLPSSHAPPEGGRGEQASTGQGTALTASFRGTQAGSQDLSPSSVLLGSGAGAPLSPLGLGALRTPPRPGQLPVPPPPLASAPALPPIHAPASTPVMHQFSGGLPASPFLLPVPGAGVGAAASPLIATLMAHNQATMAQIAQLQQQQQQLLAAASLSAAHAQLAAARLTPSPSPAFAALAAGMGMGMGMGLPMTPLLAATLSRGTPSFNAAAAPPPASSPLPMMSLDGEWGTPGGGDRRERKKERAAAERRRKRSSVANEEEARGTPSKSSGRGGTRSGDTPAAAGLPVGGARSDSSVDVLGMSRRSRATPVLGPAPDPSSRRERRARRREDSDADSERAGSPHNREDRREGAQDGLRQRAAGGEGEPAGDAHAGGVPAPVRDNEGEVAQDAGQAAPPPARAGLARFVDLGLLFRLVAVSFMFTQNASNQRVYTVAAVVTLVYLYRVGVLAAVWEGVLPRCCCCCRPCLDRIGRRRPQEMAEADGRRPNTPYAVLTAWLVRGRGYILCDILAFWGALLLSLIPTWAPEDELRPYIREMEQAARAQQGRA